MRWNDSSNSSESDNEAHSAFTQTEHNIVAAYLITAGLYEIVLLMATFYLEYLFEVNSYTDTRLRLVDGVEMDDGQVRRARFTLRYCHAICSADWKSKFRVTRGPNLHCFDATTHVSRLTLLGLVFAFGLPLIFVAFLGRRKIINPSALGVISIFSNIVVLAIFVKYKELRTATNAIIINLAFTDIGVSGIGYPMSAASDLHGSWKFGYTGCQIYAALNIFFGMASIGLLTVVALDRYLTICRPDIGRSMTARSYAALILAAWINAVFWASMPTVGWASYAPDPTGATCTVNWRKNDASFVSYTMSVIAVNFVVPLTVMFYCYYNVSRTMKQYASSNCLESINVDWSDQVDVTKGWIAILWWVSECSSSDIYDNKPSNIAKMSVVMIVMFLVAWSPYSVVCLWSSFGDPRKISPAMAIIAPLFAKSSTFYNPCIYVIANKKFRRAILAMVRCQTRQEITINNALPMSVSQSARTS